MQRVMTAFVGAIVCATLAPAQDATRPSVATLPPVVVKTVPQSGDTRVDPSTAEIQVTFSKPMQDQAWSWTQISDETAPERTDKPHYLADGRTCVLPVKLQPGRTYVVWLNSEKYKGFRDPDGRPSVPYLLVFETTGQSSSRSGVRRVDLRQDSVLSTPGPG